MKADKTHTIWFLWPFTSLCARWKPKILRTLKNLMSTNSTEMIDVTIFRIYERKFCLVWFTIEKKSIPGKRPSASYSHVKFESTLIGVRVVVDFFARQANAASVANNVTKSRANIKESQNLWMLLPPRMSVILSHFLKPFLHSTVFSQPQFFFTGSHAVPSAQTAAVSTPDVQIWYTRQFCRSGK